MFGKGSKMFEQLFPRARISIDVVDIGLLGFKLECPSRRNSAKQGAQTASPRPLHPGEKQKK